MKIAHRISASNREKKHKCFMSEMRSTMTTTILDVGFSDEEYSPNDNYLEKHYPWLKSITALGIEEPDKFRKRYPDVNALKYDGEKFPFADKTFDICYSNAVIEHVGDKSAQLQFLKELKRVGKRVFFTTPNRGFPIEVHTRIPFFHWFPKVIFDFVATLCGKRFATGKYMYLLYFKDLLKLLDDAGINNYKIKKNKKFGFTMDFVVIIDEIVE